MPYNQLYRPQYHFSPAANWTNDPNGMVYYAGEYHLFFQYHPHDTKWGPMHWGHAISTDLLSWEELPIALEPDDLGTIFSGCVVIDQHNTSGLQTGDEQVLVALYTQHEEKNQKQSLAYSNDKGRTWTKYEGNPVLPNQGISDFRDPKVFWHEPSQQWIMTLVCYDHVQFYASPNLIEWSFLSAFGKGHGAHTGVWECPDLFELAVDGDPQQSKWVLIVSVFEGAPNGGSGVQYFIGHFDGHTFTNDNDPEQVLWADYGRDFYAAVTWYEESLPLKSRLWLGWMNNWVYANEIPTSPWRGSMTLPRELRLRTTSEEQIRLIQTPLKELEQLREKQLFQAQDRRITQDNVLLISEPGDTFEILLQLERDNVEAETFAIQISDQQGKSSTITLEQNSTQLTVSRSNPSVIFHEQFAGEHCIPLPVHEDIWELHIFIDASLMEIYINKGEIVFSNQFFLDDHVAELQLYTAGGQVLLSSLEVYSLKSTWR